MSKPTTNVDLPIREYTTAPIYRYNHSCLGGAALLIKSLMPHRLINKFYEETFQFITVKHMGTTITMAYFSLTAMSQEMRLFLNPVVTTAEIKAILMGDLSARNKL